MRLEFQLSWLSNWQANVIADSVRTLHLIELSLPIWAQTVQNPFLYRIATARGNNYILGTIHAEVHAEDFRFDIKSLVKSTNVFMPEMDSEEWKLEPWQKNSAAALRLYVKEIPAAKKRVNAWTAQRLVKFGFPPELAPQLADGDCTELTLLFEFGGGLPLDAQLMQVAHLSHRRVVNLDTVTLRNQAPINCFKRRLRRTFLSNSKTKFRLTRIATAPELAVDFLVSGQLEFCEHSSP